MEEYQGRKVVVRWDIMKCAHAGKCVKALPSVFNVEHTPWVNPDGADLEAIQQAVAKCPARALSCEAVRKAD